MGNLTSRTYDEDEEDKYYEARGSQYSTTASNGGQSETRTLMTNDESLLSTPTTTNKVTATPTPTSPNQISQTEEQTASKPVRFAENSSSRKKQPRKSILATSTNKQVSPKFSTPADKTISPPVSSKSKSTSKSSSIGGDKSTKEKQKSLSKKSSSESKPRKEKQPTITIGDSNLHDKKKMVDKDSAVAMTAETPMSQTFRYFRKFDDTEMCIYQTNGETYTCDWDSQQLKLLSPGWDSKGQFLYDAKDNDADNDRSGLSPLCMQAHFPVQLEEMIEEPSGTIKFIDSKGRSVLTNLLPVRRFVRLYYNSKLNLWVPMTLQEESEIPFVSQLLDKAQRILPPNRDRLRILQELRDSGYDLGQLYRNYQSTTLATSKSMDDIAARFVSGEESEADITPTDPNANPELRIDGVVEPPHYYASQEIRQRDKSIVLLKRQLAKMYDSMNEKNTELETITRLNVHLEEVIANHEVQINEQADIINEKEVSIGKMQQTLSSLNSRRVELESEVQLLKGGTDMDMYLFKDGLVTEKEEHIGRLRAKVAYYQQKVREMESRQKMDKRSVVSLQNQVYRIKNEHGHIMAGVKRQFNDMEMYMMCKLVNPVQERLQQLNDLYVKLVESNRVEKLWRKTAWGQMGLARGKVRLFARIKPLLLGQHKSPFSPAPPTNTSVINILSNTDIMLMKKLDTNSNNSSLLQYQFDKIFPEESTQKEVFQEMESSLCSVLEDIHLSFFAFGQTGSGKSFTLYGSISNEGVIYQSLKSLFDQIEKYERNNATGNHIKVYVEAYDIYLEQVYDLFREPTKPSKAFGSSGENAYKEPQVQQIRCHNFAAAMRNADRANALRNQSLTIRKRNSSSSTFVLRYRVQVVENNAIGKFGVQKSHGGSLNFIDVSGIERCVGGPVSSGVYESPMKSSASPLKSSSPAIETSDPQDMEALERASISHTHKALEIALGKMHSSSQTSNNSFQSSSAAVRVLGDCFSESCRSFVLLGLSGDSGDIDSSVMTCEFAKSITKRK